MEIEWYTPPHIIKLAHQVLGDIDLDPASTLVANEWIKANKIYTKEDDGLTKDWVGSVWLNPPYDRTCFEFLYKLTQEYGKGNVTEAIALVKPSIDTYWHHFFSNYAKLRCEYRGRIRFVGGNKQEVSTPRHGNIFFYLGEDEQSFIKVFSNVGLILRTHEENTCYQSKR